MKIIRIYNQNRVVIWITIIAIVLLFIVIQLLNSLVIKQEEEQKKVVIKDEKLYENKIDIKTQVTDKQIEETNNLIIDKFIKLCNAKDIQNAYEILTDECKQNVFPTINDFEQNYINKVFNTEKLYSKQREYSNTYEVCFYDNLLTTGIINQNIEKDYYTIIENNGKQKLNICSYIGQQHINKVYENNMIRIEVIKKDVFKEYEIYSLYVVNKIDGIILLDTKKSTKTIYAQDTDEEIYYSASHEILANDLLINSNSISSLKIKYIKNYTNKSIDKLIFGDIVFNYINNTNKNEYEKTTIMVNI